MPPVPPRLPDRATARGYVLANLVLPGLGTWAAERRIAGAAQVILSQGGFALAMIWGVWFVAGWIRTKEFPTGLGSFFWPAMVGLGMFFTGWVWAFVSSLQILREARKTNA